MYDPKLHKEFFAHLCILFGPQSDSIIKFALTRQHFGLTVVCTHRSHVFVVISEKLDLGTYGTNKLDKGHYETQIL